MELDGGGMMDDESGGEEEPFEAFPWCAGRYTAYPFPAKSIPPKAAKRMSKWLRRFVGGSAEQCHAMLERDWATIRDPAVIGVREVVLRRTPRAIVVGANRACLRLDRNDVSGPEVGDRYLMTPVGKSLLRRELRRFGLDGNGALVEFLTHFAGMAEDLICTGNFVHRPPWFRVADIEIDDIDGFDEWKDALAVYHAANGNQLVIHATGKVGWWVTQEARIEERWSTVEEFLEFFATALDWQYPLDSYGPPSTRNPANHRSGIRLFRPPEDD